MPLFQTKNNVLFKVFANFDVTERPLYIEPYGNGYIHETYRVCTDGNCFILQKLNEGVFQNINILENNLNKLKELDPHDHLTPRFYRSKSGSYYVHDDSDFYRLMEYIPNCNPNDSLLLPHEQIKNAAGGFALFYKKCLSLDASELPAVISDFHKLDHYRNQLETLVEMNNTERIREVKAVINQLMDFHKKVVNIAELLEIGKLPASVVHNDAKISNILLDKDTGDFKRVIDLDTVMAGSFLYDFGDFCRSSISLKGESEYSNVPGHIDIYLFEMACDGFRAIRNDLSKKEKSLLFDSITYMTSLMATRFLIDYLKGDVYYKTEKVDENLIRACNQIELLEDLFSNENLLREIIKSKFS